MIKSRRLRWAGHVARMEDLQERYLEEGLGVDGRTIGINTTNWVDSAQDRDYWRVLVNAALNFWVP